MIFWAYILFIFFAYILLSTTFTFIIFYIFYLHYIRKRFFFKIKRESLLPESSLELTRHVLNAFDFLLNFRKMRLYCIFKLSFFYETIVIQIPNYLVFFSISILCNTSRIKALIFDFTLDRNETNLFSFEQSTSAFISYLCSGLRYFLLYFCFQRSDAS